MAVLKSLSHFHDLEDHYDLFWGSWVWIYRLSRQTRAEIFRAREGRLHITLLAPGPSPPTSITNFGFKPGFNRNISGVRGTVAHHIIGTGPISPNFYHGFKRVVAIFSTRLVIFFRENQYFYSNFLKLIVSAIFAWKQRNVKTFWKSFKKNLFFSWNQRNIDIKTFWNIGKTYLYRETSATSIFRRRKSLQRKCQPKIVWKPPRRL